MEDLIQHALKQTAYTVHQVIVDAASAFDGEDREFLIDLALDVEHVILDCFRISLAVHENNDGHIIDTDALKRLMDRHPEDAQ